MIPMPTQLSGARFLAERHRALLADSPRVGKTGAAIIAADDVLARRIDVVTTASGRAVWRRGFHTWSRLGRSVGVVGVDPDARDADVRIVSWGGVVNFAHGKRADLVILDEDHKAKNPETKCAQAVYGKLYDGGREMLNARVLARPEVRCWHLTGTPLPHDPGDMWPRMRASCPERLKRDEARGWPDVTRYDDFRSRYCIIRSKKISAFRTIPVVIGGRNHEELEARIGDFILRRTQRDIGILPPRFDLMPLIVPEARKRECFGDVNQRLILEAAAAGDTKTLDMHLGPLRRQTGVIKAKAVVEAVKDEMDGGLDKIVLMYWHREVGDLLEEQLRGYGVVRLDGATTPRDRAVAEEKFTLSKNRIFIGQIQAAGEAIDLSPAATLWFVETSFTPAHMAQASLRVTNVGQNRAPVVQVCSLEGSIDEALQAGLMRLWSSIERIVK